MRRNRKQIVGEIDGHIYAVIDLLVELDQSCAPLTRVREEICGALCSVKRWALAEWGGVHAGLEMGPFCIFREEKKSDG